MQKKPGLREIIDREKSPDLKNYSYNGPLSRSVKIAEYYGFTLIEPISITKRLPLAIANSKKKILKDKDLSEFPKGSMSVLKKYIDEGMVEWPQPVMLCHIVDKSKKISQLRLEIVGTRKSMAEAIIIRTASVILNDLGYEDIFIALNSLGDKESSLNFARELMSYYRSHINDLPPSLQHQLKKDVFRLLENENEKCKEINKEAPKPISFLSEDSQRHLREVLEFMESLDLPYEINTKIVGSRTSPPKTVFEIYKDSDRTSDGQKKERPLARGQRQNNLAQSIGFNRKVPIVNLKININRNQRGKDNYKKVKASSTNNPKIYFIQLGFEAKLKSLDVIEVLRKSKIPTHQSLCQDSFRNQLIRAENSGVPYTIIMGQKEVIENSIIWRDMETRYQESVPISKLEGFLKSLRRKKAV